MVFMSDNDFDAKLLEFVRRGDEEKVSLLKNLNKKILSSQLEKIQNNDKTVMNELFLPKWLDWSLLQAWAEKYKIPAKGEQCVLCSEQSPLGIVFQEKFICENCYIRIKNLK